MLNWTDIEVTINGTGILAENVSLNSNNNLLPAYALGRAALVTHQLTPQIMNGPFQGNIQVDYFLDLHSEPNQALLNTIKTTDFNFTYPSTQISVAGLTGFAYLESYSINVTPNNPTKTSVSYLVFTPFSGGLSPQTGNISYNPNGITGIAHGWTTFVTTTAESINFPTYEFSYNLRANWQPLYVLGKLFPDQINLLSVEENLSITKDFYKNIKSTGQEAYEFLKIPNNANIKLVEMLHNTTLNEINIAGMKAVETKLSAAVNDIVKVTSTIKKHY